MTGPSGPITVRIEGKEAFQRLLPGEPATRGMKSGAVRLKPGESVGEHSTGLREEALVVLGGQGKLICAGGEAALSGGMLLYVPPESRHDVMNTGSEDLMYVYVVSPVVP